MSTKSKLMKAVPKSIVTKQIAKGNYRGDDWGDVIKVIYKTATLTPTKTGVDIVYKGKVVGWRRENGQSWIDAPAYEAMRKEYKELRKAEILASRTSEE